MLRARPRRQPFVGIGRGQGHSRLNLSKPASRLSAAFAKFTVRPRIHHWGIPRLQEARAKRYEMCRVAQVEQRGGPWVANVGANVVEQRPDNISVLPVS